MPPPPNNQLTTGLLDQLERLPAAWFDALAGILHSQRFAELATFIEQRQHAGATVYPAHPFRALELTDLPAVRVVILGQDPYHGAGQAQGLAFSVPSQLRRPPSLRNIFIEVANDYGGDPAQFDNDLTRWARQGVLLLNTLLTVEDGQPASHAKRGWEVITDCIMQAVARDPNPKVFLLWGSHAQSKIQHISADGPHGILTANHPSPLSAQRPPVPFIGCQHFRKANDWLQARDLPPIDWTAPR